MLIALTKSTNKTNIGISFEMKTFNELGHKFETSLPESLSYVTVNGSFLPAVCSRTAFL